MKRSLNKKLSAELFLESIIEDTVAYHNEIYA